MIPSFLLKEALVDHHTYYVGWDDLRMMQEPVEQRRGEDLILEYIIMPLSLIVLLVEANLGAVSYPLLSNIPSRASLWPADIP